MGEVGDVGVGERERIREWGGAGMREKEERVKGREEKERKREGKRMNTICEWKITTFARRYLKKLNKNLFVIVGSAGYTIEFDYFIPYAPDTTIIAFNLTSC